MLAYVPAPQFYSPMQYYPAASPRHEYLRAMAKVQAQEDYLRRLAVEEELRMQNQLRAAYQRRLLEAQLLSELALVRSGFDVEPYPVHSPDYHFGYGPYQSQLYRNTLDRDEYSSGNLSDLRRRPRVFPRRLYSTERVADRFHAHRCSSSMEELRSLLQSDWAGQEPKATEQKCIPAFSTRCPCRANSLNPHRQIPSNVESSGCRMALNSGDNTKIPSKCEQKSVHPFNFMFTCPGAAKSPQGDRHEFAEATVLPESSARAAAVPTVESIKEELEKRLYTNPDIEIQDTVRALLASLTEVAKTSEVKAESLDIPRQSVDTKGKAKEVASSESAGQAPADPTTSLKALRDIETAFHALESDFVFPAHLEFDTTPPSPALSIHSNSSSPTSVLTYTSTNHPVRYYEQALSSLLTQLDAIESFGSDEIRARRREIVAKVETTLQEVEREVERRLENQKRKEFAANKGREILGEAFESTQTDRIPEATQPQSDGPSGAEKREEDSDLATPPQLEDSLSASSADTLTPSDSHPNGEHTSTETPDDRSLIEPTSINDHSAVDETVSLPDSSLTVHAPSSEGGEVNWEVPDGSAGTTLVAETFPLPASSGQEPLASKLKDSASDEESELIDAASDGGWSEIAPDA